MNDFAKSRGNSLDALVSHVSKIVASESGNVLGLEQESMVRCRMENRLLDLGGINSKEYSQYLQRNYQKEIVKLVSLLTTHHTFFFREFSHFEFIRDNLEKLVDEVKRRGERVIKVCSFACSRGQEVYSLACFLEYHLRAFPGMTYEIFGSDIDAESVAFAKKGIYLFDDVKSVPRIYLSGNWKRGTGDISRFVMINKSIKKRCRFETLNLLDLKSLSKERFDIVFCRNAFIYFDDATITSICRDFKHVLHKRGVFFSGLCENLKSLDFYKKTLAPSVYLLHPPSDILVRAPSKEIIRKNVLPFPIKMLLVDDSPSILKLLEKVFFQDPAFEVVGVAANGLLAEEFLKNHHVDAMTLDIHMPVMTGVEYLKKNHSKGHPKVIVVSSASREDTRYAQLAIEYGASDFVEKPALNNLYQRAEEIKAKVKMSFFCNTSTVPKGTLTASFSNSFKIDNAAEKARVIFCTYGDKEKVFSFFEDFIGPQPATIVFLEGSQNFLSIFENDFKMKGHGNCQLYQHGMALENNRIYLCDFERDFDHVAMTIKDRANAVGIFGQCSDLAISKLSYFSNVQLLIEENPELNVNSKNVATDILPWTSFYHVATEFLSKGKGAFENFKK